jgi:hypothetical protein
MSLAELASVMGVLENDLNFLLKMWIIRPAPEVSAINQASQATGKIIRGSLHFDIDTKELSWIE